MTLNDLQRELAARVNDLLIRPFMHFIHALNQSDRRVLVALLVVTAVLAFAIARRKGKPARRRPGFGLWRFPIFQNSGESRVARLLLAQCFPPDYHLMNHVTLRMEDGTTEVDHILVSRYGVFVIETKDFNGWIFADANDEKWTQVLFRRKSRFQNPLFQNKRHVRAVRELLDFLPPESVRPIVVFTGNAEFKTAIPSGVIDISQLAEHVQQHAEVVMSSNRLQFCVGRIETARLAISRETDVEHVRSLARRHRIMT